MTTSEELATVERRIASVRQQMETAASREETLLVTELNALKVARDALQYRLEAAEEEAINTIRAREAQLEADWDQWVGQGRVLLVRCSELADELARYDRTSGFRPQRQFVAALNLDAQRRAFLRRNPELES